MPGWLRVALSHAGVTILVYRYVMTGVWDTLAVCNW